MRYVFVVSLLGTDCDDQACKSVSVTFGPLVPEDNAIRGTLGMASLIGSDDQAITILGGEILAVTREGE